MNIDNLNQSILQMNPAKLFDFFKDIRKKRREGAIEKERKKAVKGKKKNTTDKLIEKLSPEQTQQLLKILKGL